jgi:hypothetical protein
MFRCRVMERWEAYWFSKMAKEWQHMDHTWRSFKAISNMNLVSLWFIVYVSMNSEVLANVEFYPGK